MHGTGRPAAASETIVGRSTGALPRPYVIPSNSTSLRGPMIHPRIVYSPNWPSSALQFLHSLSPPPLPLRQPGLFQSRLPSSPARPPSLTRPAENSRQAPAITVADCARAHARPIRLTTRGATVVPRPARRLAHRAQGLQGRACYATGLDNPRLIRFGPQRRPLPRRKPAGKIEDLPRRRSPTASQSKSPSSPPASPALRHRLLSPRRRTASGFTSATPMPSCASPITTATSRPPARTEQLADLPGGGRLRGGGHWTRDLVFSHDGTQAVRLRRLALQRRRRRHASRRIHRADVLEFTPEGKFVKVYASGMRNCVGEAINPTTGELWCSTNERELSATTSSPTTSPTCRRTASTAGRGTTWAAHQDPRLEGKHPELKSKVITPDILLEPHFASLEMTFYEGSQFPAEFKGDGFAAEHGSWNRAQRAGYEVIRLPMHERPRHRRVRRFPHRLHRRQRRRRCLGPPRGRRSRSTTARYSSPTTDQDPSGTSSTPASDSAQLGAVILSEVGRAIGTDCAPASRSSPSDAERRSR